MGADLSFRHRPVEVLIDIDNRTDSVVYGKAWVSRLIHKRLVHEIGNILSEETEGMMRLQVKVPVQVVQYVRGDVRPTVLTVLIAIDFHRAVCKLEAC